VKLKLIPGGDILPPLKTDQRLVDWQACVDGMNDVDNPGGKHASKAVLAAGQAAVDVINARRGRS
jgi:hypothetical protein